MKNLEKGQAMRRILRLIGFGYILFFYFITCILARIFIYPQERRSVFFSKMNQVYASLFLKMVNVEVSWSEMPESYDENKAYLVAANHLTYIDMLVIVTKFLGTFISTQEVRNTPFLGWIASGAGCIFIERRRKRLTSEIRRQELDDMGAAIHEKRNIVFFPEATSTNGEEVLQFKAGLFEAAVERNIEVLPITINYTEINGDEDVHSNRDSVFYYGDMEFGSHLWRFLGTKKIKVHLHVHDPIKAEEGEDHKSLANSAHRLVSSRYRRIKKSAQASA